ncbi:crossover junction endodeoxyribonuclease RuvC [Calditrichota bacterium]
MIILGVDPGLSATGYGAINVSGNQLTPLTWGVIRSKGKELGIRLLNIHQQLSQIIDLQRPDIVAVEEVFSGKNPRTAIVMGHARGVILLAVEESGAKLNEFPTRLIKQSVVGRGGASKQQVEYMVRRLLNLGTADLAEDASDALAVAICCHFKQGVLDKMQVKS